MRKLKKSYFLGVVWAVIILLAIVNCFRSPSANETLAAGDKDSTVVCPVLADTTLHCDNQQELCTSRHRYLEKRMYASPRFRDAAGKPIKNRIYSVPSFHECFADLQDTQIVAARKWGVSPVADRKEAELRKKELVYVGSNPYYTMDEGMNRSIPYLVPQAAELLQRISRNFLDSLAIKSIPLHTLIVTSVLRTEEDVRKLRRHNVNASEQSCHRYGTTFDISYNRYTTVSSPDGPERRAVRNDSLKWVLSEVLRDLRGLGYCYVKHEVKQGCYHITVR